MYSNVIIRYLLIRDKLDHLRKICKSTQRTDPVPILTIIADPDPTWPKRSGSDRRIHCTLWKNRTLANVKLLFLDSFKDCEEIFDLFQNRKKTRILKKFKLHGICSLIYVDSGWCTGISMWETSPGTHDENWKLEATGPAHLFTEVHSTNCWHFQLNHLSVIFTALLKVTYFLYSN